MLFIAIMLLGVALLLIVLSVLPRHAVPNITLPERKTRRIWLPIGLILITLSGLFGVMYTATLPSSPLRQTETANHSTRWGYHTQQAQTQRAQQIMLLTTTATPRTLSEFEVTATVLIRGATTTMQVYMTETAAATRSTPTQETP